MLMTQSKMWRLFLSEGVVGIALGLQLIDGSGTTTNGSLRSSALAHHGNFRACACFCESIRAVIRRADGTRRLCSIARAANGGLEVTAAFSAAGMGSFILGAIDVAISASYWHFGFVYKAQHSPLARNGGVPLCGSAHNVNLA
jgi:hypothetical protein